MSVQKQINHLLAQRAAEWFEVYRTGQEDQYPAFVAWVTESPRHLQEFLEIASRYSAVRDVLASGAIDHKVLLRKMAPQVSALRSPELADIRRSGTRRRRWKWATRIAAAVAVAGITFGIWRSVVPAWQSVETQVGEQRIVQLPDGSVLTLNAQSQAKVRLTRWQRNIRLARGEALFKVAPDKTRPFLVQTQDATVRAVGTQFNVYARPDGSTTVAVLEGRVEVTGDVEKTLLGSGEAARVVPTGKVQKDAHPNIGSAVAWRQRRLVFDRTPLEDMIQEFNRYNRTLKFRLIDVEPGSYHFTGSFDADDPKSLALLLSKEPKLSVDYERGEIVVQRR